MSASPLPSISKKGCLGYQVYKSHRVYGLVYKFLHVNYPNVGKYTIPGSYGKKEDLRPQKIDVAPQKMMVGERILSI